MTRDDIIAEARSWIKPTTIWMHQASLKGVGADCIGYIAGVAAACGSLEGQRFLANTAWRCYGGHPDPVFLFEVCDQLLDRIAIAPKPRSADVLVFTCGHHPMHFGFAAPNGMLLHAWLVAGRVCEHRLDASWRARIVRAYRIRGIA